VEGIDASSTKSLSTFRRVSCRKIAVPIEGKDPLQRAGDGVEERVTRQVGDDRVVDLEQCAVVLDVPGGSRVWQ
jgi:hypothetical protein